MRKLYQSNKKDYHKVLGSVVTPLVLFLVLLFGSLVTPNTTFAQPQVFVLGDGPNIGDMLKSIYNIALPLGVVLAILLIMRAGYMFMTSQGDPQKVMAGKETLTSAIMGMLFVILSIAILRIIIGELITGTTVTSF